MSTVINPDLSNAPRTVVIAGSAPGTKGDPGVGIADVEITADGSLSVSLTDGTQKIVDASALAEAASEGALNTLETGGLPNIDLSKAVIGPYTMADVAQAALGKSGLPVDVTNNGGVIMAGPTPLPDGYISNGGVIIQKSTAEDKNG